MQTTVTTADENEVITSFLVVDQGKISSWAKNTVQQQGILKLNLGVKLIVLVQSLQKF